MNARNTIISMLLSLAAIAFQGCASSSYGPKLDQATADTIIRGKTTRAELIAKFGQPAMSTSGPGGVEYMAWNYSDINISASNFIPVVGTFVGKRETKSGNLRVTLNKDKVVEDYHFMGSGYSNR
jgi:outer membrane protein assembly factor BamE (lipoprotein component of BamABCDE complex)